MKNFQQNLLMALAFGLCVLCAYQWYVQTQQRNEIASLNHFVYEKSVAIRDYTNSIETLNLQVAQMDARITELKTTMKTNEALVVRQARDVDQLKAGSQALTNEVVEYKKAVGSLETKLKEAYDGIAKQNHSFKELVAQRDEFVQKYNESMKERNDVVAKYNSLVDQVKKIQSASKNP